MIAMKIGMKEDMGVADKMTLSNFGLCAVRRGAPKQTWDKILKIFEKSKFWSY